uniref:OBERON-like protein n=1 Tax=Steinernema glaseri TaxID=37863 RepID=A0A1I7Z5X5_9BILA
MAEIEKFKALRDQIGRVAQALLQKAEVRKSMKEQKKELEADLSKRENESFDCAKEMRLATEAAEDARAEREVAAARRQVMAEILDIRSSPIKCKPRLQVGMEHPGCRSSNDQGIAKK